MQPMPLSQALNTTLDTLLKMIRALPPSHHAECLKRFSLKLPHVQLAMGRGNLTDRTGLDLKHLMSQFMSIPMTVCESINVQVAMPPQHQLELVMEIQLDGAANERVAVGSGELSRLCGGMEELLEVVNRVRTAPILTKKKRGDSEARIKGLGRRARELCATRVDPAVLSACLTIMGIDDALIEKTQLRQAHFRVLAPQQTKQRNLSKLIDLTTSIKPKDSSIHIYQQPEQKKIKAQSQNKELEQPLDIDEEQ